VEGRQSGRQNDTHLDRDFRSDEQLVAHAARLRLSLPHGNRNPAKTRHPRGCVASARPYAHQVAVPSPPDVPFVGTRRKQHCPLFDACRHDRGHALVSAARTLLVEGMALSGGSLTLKLSTTRCTQCQVERVARTARRNKRMTRTRAREPATQAPTSAPTCACKRGLADSRSRVGFRGAQRLHIPPWRAAVARTCSRRAVDHANGSWKLYTGVKGGALRSC